MRTMDDSLSGPQKRHKHKEYCQKPPSQILYVWEPQIVSSKHRKKPKHKEFLGGGVLGVPKFFMLKLLRVFIFAPLLPIFGNRCWSASRGSSTKAKYLGSAVFLAHVLKRILAQCSATPATVAATPPCSATPFQTQISVRHLPAKGGGGATPKFLGGRMRDTGATPAKRYKIQETRCDTCSATRVRATGGTRQVMCN